MTGTGTTSRRGEDTGSRRRVTQAQMNGPRIVRAMETDDTTPFGLYRAVAVPRREDRPAGRSVVLVGVVAWDPLNQHFEIFRSARDAAERFALGHAARELARDWSLFGYRPDGHEEWYGYCDTLSFAVDLLVSGEHIAAGHHPYRRLIKGTIRTSV